MTFNIYLTNKYTWILINTKKKADQRLIASQMKKQMIQTIEDYRNQTLDQDFQSSKLFKPIIKAQKEVKDTLDQKQDKNQKALASNLEDIAMLQYTYEKAEKRQNYQLVTNQQ